MSKINKDLNIVAIIPARGGSKGIPHKNITNFCGRPLIAWSIEQAARSKYINGVFVTSDDNRILAVAKRWGAIPIKRPKKLATDASPAEEALRHAIDYIKKASNRKPEIVVFLQATSPVRATDDIDGALETLIFKRYDSLFSAALLDDFTVWKLKNGRYASVTFDYKHRGMRQEREPYYLENGSIYIFKTDLLERCSNRLGGNIGAYIMPLWKSHEIDGPEDFEICRYFMETGILSNASRHMAVINDVSLVVYDFDGVLTDNGVTVNEKGLETVRVNRSDGLAIGILKKAGIKQIILSTEKNRVVKVRAKKLGIKSISGIDDKKSLLISYCSENKVDLKKVIYVGNDINDLNAMKIVGYPVCPIDAASEIKRISKIVLDVPGGAGVVRGLVRYLDLGGDKKGKIWRKKR